MFSKTCEYAIRASIYIARESLKERKASLKDIAWELKSPEAFTAKTLQKLVKAGIISSSRGATGGFWIDPNGIEQIKISRIVLAIDGDQLFKRCSLGLKQCSEDHPCPLHFMYHPIKQQMVRLVDDTSLADLLMGVDEGISYLSF